MTFFFWTTSKFVCVGTKSSGLKESLKSSPQQGESPTSGKSLGSRESKIKTLRLAVPERHSYEPGHIQSSFQRNSQRLSSPGSDQQMNKEIPSPYLSQEKTKTTNRVQNERNSSQGINSPRNSPKTRLSQIGSAEEAGAETPTRNSPKKLKTNEVERNSSLKESTFSKEKKVIKPQRLKNIEKNPNFTGLTNSPFLQKVSTEGTPKKKTNNRVDVLKVKIHQRMSEIKQQKGTRKTSDGQNQTLQEILDEDHPLEKDLAQSQHELMDKLTAQGIKYIRLMKLLRLEKTKVEDLKEIENHQRIVIQKDTSIIEELKQLLNQLANDTKYVGDEKIVKARKLIDMREKLIQKPKEDNNDIAAVFDSMVHEKQKKDEEQQQMQTVPFKREDSKILSPSEVHSRDSEERKRTHQSNFDSKKRPGNEEVGSQKPQTLGWYRNERVPERKSKANSPPPLIQDLPRSMTTKFANVPILGRKRENVKRENPMIDVIAKLKRSLAKMNKTKEFMPLKIILKGITSFYAEKLAASKDSLLIREQDMLTFVYNTFLNTYGLPKFARKKFSKFMVSVKKYSSLERVAMFARMCCLMDDTSLNLAPDETKQYFIGLEYLLTNHSLGVPITNSDSDKRHYAPFIRVQEFARIYCEERGMSGEFEALKQELEKMKEVDPTGLNKAGIIKVDLFLAKIIEVHKLFKAIGEAHIKAVFDACNFDGNIVLSNDEFSILMKSIEPERFDFTKIEEIYAANEEILDPENQGIPFKRFVTLCLENDYFSSTQQMKFLEVKDQAEISKSFQTVKEIWPSKKERLIQLLDFNKVLTEPEIIEFWEIALKSLDNDLQTVQSDCYVTGLLKYRIIIMEMNATFNANIPFS